MKPAILFIIICIILNSCVGYIAPCENPTLHVDFEDFDSLEVIPVIVKWYNEDSSFNALEDSIILDSFYYAAHSWNKTYGIDGNHNWVIDIPKASKTYYLRNIYFEKEPAERAIGERDGCTNTVHYFLNDSSYTLEGTRLAKYGYTINSKIELLR